MAHLHHDRRTLPRLFMVTLPPYRRQLLLCLLPVNKDRGSVGAAAASTVEFLGTSLSNNAVVAQNELEDALSVGFSMDKDSHGACQSESTY
jgi:hypothetical protein